MSVLGLSQPSRALIVNVAGNWKYLVLRYFEIHLEGDAVPSGGAIVVSDFFVPMRITLVPCAPISSGFTASSSGT